MRSVKKNFKRIKSGVKIRKHRQSVIVFCEGETEEGYFTGFRVRVKTMKGGSALKVVEDSLRWIKQNKAFESYDQLWVVFDKDASTDEEFNQAIRQAKESGLNVAYSNESFELWIILHFEKVNHEILRKDYEVRIKKYIPWYRERNKGKKQGEKLFNQLLDLTDTAIKNAKARYRKEGNHSNPSGEVSSTTVFRLIEMLVERSK